MKTHSFPRLLAALYGLVSSLAPLPTFAATFYLATDRDVKRLDPDGTRTIIVPNGSENQSLAFDSSGNLFYITSDEILQLVHKLTPDGALSDAVTNLVAPFGLAFDPLDNMYISERGAGRITKVTPDGFRSVFATGLGNPLGIAFDNEGNLFAANGQSIIEISPLGVTSTFVTPTDFSPYYLAFDSADNLYASGPGAIQKYTPDGTGSVFATHSFRTGPMVFDGDTLYQALGTGIAVYSPDGVGTSYLGDSDLELDFTAGIALGPDVVPEPVTVSLLLVCAPLLFGYRRRSLRES